MLVAAPAAAPALAEAYDPDVVAGRTGRESRRPGVRATSCTPTSRCCSRPAARPARPSWCAWPATACWPTPRRSPRPSASATTDVAATTLPLHYCYGLSVLHSHLLRGRGTAAHRLSVVDECFWAASRATASPPSPACRTPSSCSSGRLRRPSTCRPALPHPGRRPDGARAGASLRRARPAPGLRPLRDVRRHRGHRPDERAAPRPRRSRRRSRSAARCPARPSSLPPSSDPDGLEPGVGELVFTGPNVMLGYAASPADLALGATVDELRTGDLARRRPDGLWEVVGRTQPDRQGLRPAHRPRPRRARAGAGDRRGRRGRRGPARRRRRRRRPARRRPSAVRRDRRRRRPGSPPRLSTSSCCPTCRGCPTARSTTARWPTLAPAPSRRACAPGVRRAASLADDVTALFGHGCSAARRRPTTRSSPSAATRCPTSRCRCGSRSCSATCRPAGPRMPAAALADAARSPRGGAARSRPTSCCGRWRSSRIVGSHANLFTLLGGAHVLLAIVGFNLGRFQLGDQARRERTRADAARGSPGSSCRRCSSSAPSPLSPATSRGAGGAAHGLHRVGAGPSRGGATGSSRRSPSRSCCWPRSSPSRPSTARPRDGTRSRSPSCSRSCCCPPATTSSAFPATTCTAPRRALAVRPRLGRCRRPAPIRQRLVVTRARPGAGARRSSRRRSDRHGLPRRRPARADLGPAVRLPAVAAPLVGVLAASSLWIYLLHWRVYPWLRGRRRRCWRPCSRWPSGWSRRPWRTPRRARPRRVTGASGIADTLTVLCPVGAPESSCRDRAPRREDAAWTASR